MALKLLLIGDERKNRRLLNWAFAPALYYVETATSAPEVAAALRQRDFQAACLDGRTPEHELTNILEVLHQDAPRLPVVAIIDHRDARLLRHLREKGIAACVVTPFDAATLRSTLERVAARVPIARPTRPAASALAPASAAPRSSESIVASDEAAKRMLEIALRAATSNVSILILGETGTGKNLLAQTIHERSALRNKPFVTVNCPSLSRELLESDLFGHVRGAFTGAVADTWGKVAAAEGGTLFLDEIGDLPAVLQPKLLRLLQDRQYERIGETISRTANVRIIAATNRDLKAEVAAGRFREDLFYRLNVIAVEVPPLRNRPSDIMPAAEQFLESISRQLGKRCPTFTPEARRLLESHDWPGNLRELRNAIERAAVLSDAATLGLDDFPALLRQPAIPHYQIGSRISLHALETAHIQMVVANTPTLEEAARILEIDKSTLYRKRRSMDARVAKFAPADDRVVAISG